MEFVRGYGYCARRSPLFSVRWNNNVPQLQSRLTNISKQGGSRIVVIRK